LATGRIAAAHGRFNRIRQVAPMCTPSSLEPTQVHTPNGISISSAVFAQLTAAGPYTLQWAAPFPLKIALALGRSGLPCNTCVLWPTTLSIPNGILIGLAILALLTADSPYTL